MKTVFIYTLREPDTGEIRYVGKTEKPKQRLQAHLRRAGNEKSHRACWLNSLISRGLKPVMEVEDEAAEECWQQLEVAYIEFFLSQGCDLVNGTPGGDAPPVNKGVPKTARHRSNISAAKIGVKCSKEHCENISRSHKGLKLGPQTPEHVEKRISKIRGAGNGCYGKTPWNKGRAHPAETRARISAARIGQKPPPRSAEYCAAISARQTGKKRAPLSPEWRAKLGAASRAYWARKRAEKTKALE